ncbi:hypothetical protein EON83_13505 [bacterium]|nr:MAG: hypothetical protein EON83_13505 [bacterium]
MSLRPLASLIVKMLGLYAVINALPTISGVVAPLIVAQGTPAPFNAAPLSMAAALGGALQMLFGIGLWAFSDGIAHSAVPAEGELPVRRNEGLMEIGFSVVGVYLLANCATNFVRYATNRYLLNQNGFGADRYLDTYISSHAGLGDALSIGVQGVLGLILVLCARGLVRGMATLRNVGRDEEFRNEASEV